MAQAVRSHSRQDKIRQASAVNTDPRKSGTIQIRIKGDAAANATGDRGFGYGIQAESSTVEVPGRVKAITESGSATGAAAIVCVPARRQRKKKEGAECLLFVRRYINT